MKKLVKIGTLIIGMLLLMVTIAHAQTENVERAYDFYTNKQYDSAKVYIDRAIKEPENANDPTTWQVRGFVYKDVYNKYQKTNKFSPYRLEGLNALKKSISLDESKELLNDNIQAMKYLLSTIYNDVDESLDPIEYEKAIELFRKYQEYYRIIDPSQEGQKQREINFGLSLGTVYNTVVESNRDSAVVSKFIGLAQDVFKKILEMDPKNVSANYNMGILYYNQAVQLVKYQDYDVDLSLFEEIQDQSAKLFKTSLPFMKTAYEQAPEREDVLSGIAGIYFGLNDKATSDLYRQKLQNIKKNKK